MQSTMGSALAHSRYVSENKPEVGLKDPCPTGGKWNAALKKCESIPEETEGKSRELNLKEKHNRSKQSSSAYLANLRNNEKPKDKENRRWMERNTGPSSWK